MTNIDHPAGHSSPGEARDDATQRLQDEGRHAASKLRHQAEGYADTQKAHVAERVEGVAEALRDASGRLRERDDATAAGLTDTAADQLERVSHALRDKDIGTMLAEAGDLARSHPAIFIGGAVALGFMAGRFLRASGEHDQHHRGQMPAGATPGL